MGKPIMISWEDIVFENRNKDYGAYTLRYGYPYYLTFSALIVIAVFLSSMIVGTRLFKGKNIQSKGTTKIVYIDYTELAPPPPIEKVYVPPPKKETTVVVQKKVQKYVAPKVVVEEVKEEEEMLTMDEVVDLLDTTEFDFESMGGGGEGEVQVVAAPPPLPEPEPVFTGRPPAFPGGEEALRRWLEENLKYPATAARMGIEGIVIVEFNVDVDGELIDISIVRSLQKLCDREALRLIKSMPTWTPGESNGTKVVVKQKLTIPFVLSKS